MAAIHEEEALPEIYEQLLSSYIINNIISRNIYHSDYDCEENFRLLEN